MDQRIENQLIEMEDCLTQLGSAITAIQQSKEVTQDMILALKQAQEDYSEAFKTTLTQHKDISTELLDKNEESIRSIEGLLKTIKSTNLAEYLADIKTKEDELLNSIATSTQSTSTQLKDMRKVLIAELKDMQEAMASKKDIASIKNFLYVSIGLGTVAVLFSLIGYFT